MTIFLPVRAILSLSREETEKRVRYASVLTVECGVNGTKNAKCSGLPLTDRNEGGTSIGLEEGVRKPMTGEWLIAPGPHSGTESMLYLV